MAKPLKVHRRMSFKGRKYYAFSHWTWKGNKNVITLYLNRITDSMAEVDYTPDIGIKIWAIIIANYDFHEWLHLFIRRQAGLKSAETFICTPGCEKFVCMATNAVLTAIVENTEWGNDYGDRIKHNKGADITQEDIFEELQTDVIVEIAASDLPEEDKRRLIRTNKGQIDAMTKGVAMLIDEHYQFGTGWVNRNGDYYGCELGQHIPLSHKLVFQHYMSYKGDAEQKLEKEGWLKCTGGLWYYAAKTLQVTEEQIKTIEKWTQKWGKVFKWNGTEINLRELKEMLR